MSAFKKLNKSDVTVVPYAANKHWNFTRSTSPTFSTIYTGKNVTGSFSPVNDPVSNNQYQRLIYNGINQLFYQTYTSSLNTSSLASSIYYESASQQRPTSSYFVYNDNKNLIKNFPTGANQTISILGINRDVYGNKIMPNTFTVASASLTLNVYDDGYGNVYDSTTHIGNIFYAQGLVVITNQSYQQLFINTFTVNFDNEYIIQENEVRCLINESDFNLSYNPTLHISGSQYIVSSSDGYTLTGSIDSTVRNFATGSDFTPYATQIGLYNDDNDLLAVAKFAKPLLISPNTDMTFVVKYDI